MGQLKANNVQNCQKCPNSLLQRGKQPFTAPSGNELLNYWKEAQGMILLDISFRVTTILQGEK